MLVVAGGRERQTLVPLQVTLAYPSADTPDPGADADLYLTGGHWRTGLNRDVQADWAEAFAGLALCKPAVRTVNWMQLSDAEPHLFPHCGLVDGHGQVKPALGAGAVSATSESRAKRPASSSDFMVGSCRSGFPA